MIGPEGEWGPTIDLNREFAAEYVRTVGRYWLTEYHIDGFRYDDAKALYDTPEGRYATIAYDVYSKSLTLSRFTPSGGAGEYSRVIQCPEALDMTEVLLRETYSSTAWEASLLNLAQSTLASGGVDGGFADILDLAASGFPTTKEVRDTRGVKVDMPVRQLQYIGSHDASQIVAYIGNPAPDFAAQPLASRALWFKLQPLVIALYTGQGIPMLWQGQEFADNWVVAPPNNGDARIHIRRDVHWEYFYDDCGTQLVKLHRRLGQLRRSCAALRSSQSLEYHAQSRPHDGVIAYGREAGNEFALIALNFSDSSQQLTLQAPAPGTYSERIDGVIQMQAAATGDPLTLTVPSNYGYVLTGS